MGVLKGSHGSQWSGKAQGRRCHYRALGMENETIEGTIDEGAV